MLTKLVLLLMLPSMCANAQKIEPNLYFFMDSNSFSGTGRWVPSNSNEKAAYPSETEIDCNRISKTCIEATAEYYSGHPHVSVAYFAIVTWDAQQIIATSSDAICMVQTIIVSVPDKTISETHSIKKMSPEKAQACETFGASGTQTDVFVVKNSPRWKSDPYGESSNKY
ncbi:MAG TPA: hypothetical protein VN151_08380 [Terracidiphilus sp.]|nr:hypothetical protein [Terracidiphilus sp.]